MASALGLSTRAAEALQKKHGPNEVVPSRLGSKFFTFKRILLDPMGLMLLGLGSVYWILGEKTDAVTLWVAYLPVTGVDVLLDLKASRALRALKASLQSFAKVYRDGKIVALPVRDLVPGDVLIFEEGQVLPADGIVIEAHGLGVNEATLTGEALPVDKKVEMGFYCGTSVLQGRGLGEVVEIGSCTRYGHLAKLVGESHAERSPLQKLIQKTVKKIFIFALFLAGGLFLLEWSRRGAWVPGLVIALTFAMSAVPEEFPLVFTLYLSLGAYRLSKRGVLVKSLPSVETLGGVDVICTDKTGTLTEGKFKLKELLPMNSKVDLAELELTALMACEQHPVDSMEQAIAQVYSHRGLEVQAWRLRWDHPFDLERKIMSHVWEKDSQCRVALKGAVESVLNQCVLTQSERTRIQTQAEALSSRGFRLLGLAGREGVGTGFREQDEAGLSFLGLLVFEDPIRSSAVPALEACRKAGIEIKMVTGDHPLTAQAIGERLGMGNLEGRIFRGEDLNKMKDPDRLRAYQGGVIFARMSPTQKYELVKALQSAGKTVAMTGDGINDAPTLKSADIGISMGEDASDVARASARMILMKSDFGGIVSAVFEGRRIFANLKRSFSYLISFHIPVVLLVLIPALFGWGDFLLPVHIVLLELLVHPVSAFAFENLPLGDAPRRQELLGRSALMNSVLQGTGLSLLSLYVFKFKSQTSLPEARSIGFAMVLFGNLFFVLNEVWPELRPRVILTALGLFGMTLAVFEWPVLTNYLHLIALNGTSLGTAFALSALATVPFGILRVYQKKHLRTLN